MGDGGAAGAGLNTDAIKHLLSGIGQKREARAQQDYGLDESFEMPQQRTRTAKSKNIGGDTKQSPPAQPPAGKKGKKGTRRKAVESDSDFGASDFDSGYYDEEEI